MTRWQYILSRARLTFRWRRSRWQKLRQLSAQSLSFPLLVDICFAALDLVGLFDFWEVVSNTLTPGIRSLTERELRLLKPIFGDSVPYPLIRIDERAWVGPRFGRFCYVSFLTINSWGPMHPATLVHEVVHVWQYTHRGAVYIPRALRAQWSEMGYNYGGLAPLQSAACLEDFNYEQQADIIEDAYRLANSFEAQWVPGRGAEILPVYYPFLAEVRAVPPASAGESAD
ncbi:hypothetical protein [Neolewinella agarilytica]|uniref:hypothetical protein n=1 Tax=Neolewinella agarilytica TaxID=478744 RepID=UPI0023577AFB|nr:hypothetical protein [Neolewinella agarilytica]